MILIAPELLAELAAAQLRAQVAQQQVEILTLRIAVRHRLPDGATWDVAGVVTLPSPAPVPGEAGAQPNGKALESGLNGKTRHDSDG